MDHNIPGTLGEGAFPSRSGWRRRVLGGKVQVEIVGLGWRCGLCYLRKVLRGHEVWRRARRCEGDRYGARARLQHGHELMAPTPPDTSRGLIRELSHQPVDRRCLKKEWSFRVVHLVQFSLQCHKHGLESRPLRPSAEQGSTPNVSPVSYFLVNDTPGTGIFGSSTPRMVHFLNKRMFRKKIGIYYF